jgi:hypothetical protein
MANRFHTPTTDRLAAQDFGMGARVAFGSALTVNDETIALVGRSTR